MSLNHDDQLTIRKYLLRELDEESRHEFEQRLLTDDHLLEELLVCEDELVDQYLGGELSKNEVAMFENRFLATAERQHKLQFARAFRKYAATHGSDDPKTVLRSLTPTNNWQQFFSPSPWRVAAFAAVILVAAFGVWRIYFHQSDVDKGLIALNAAYREQRPVEARITKLDYAPFSTTRGEADRVNSLERERAERYLLDAVRNHPSSASYHALGKFYMANKEFDKAIAQLEAAVKGDPNNAQIYADLGAALLEKGKIDLVRGDSAETASENGKGLEELAHSLENLSKALEIEPNLLEAFFNRALCYQSMMLPRQAEEDWRAYLRKDSTSQWAEEARRNLKTLAERQRSTSSRKEEVLSDFLTAYLDRNDEKAWRLVSVNREDLREGSISQQLFNKCLESSLKGQDNESQNTINALAYLGQLETRMADDHFSADLSQLCQTATPQQRSKLVQAHDLMKLGHNYYSHSTYDKAIDAYENAKRAFAEALDHPGVMQAQCWIGISTLEAGETQRSLRLFKALAQECKNRKYKWMMMRTLNLISSAHFNLNEYTKAIDYCNRSLDVAQQIGDEIGAFNALDLLTEYYRTIDNYAHAMSCIEHSLPLIDCCPFNPIQMWRHYAIVASALNSAGLYAAALAYQNEALQRAVAEGESSMVSVSYVHLGLIYGKLGNFAEGLRNAQLAYEKASQRADETTGKQMMAYSSLGVAQLHREGGKNDEAIANYNKSIQLYSELEFPTLLYQAHKGRLACFISKGDASLAKDELKITLDLIENSRSRILESNDRNNFFSTEQSVYDLAIEFAYSALHDPEKAFNYSEQSRARSLLDLMNTDSKVVIRNGAPDVRFSSVFKPLDLEAIQQRLPNQTQVVEYAALDEKIIVWVIDKEGVKFQETRINQRQLTEKVRQYLRLISHPPTTASDDKTILAKELFDILVRPIDNILDKTKKLCIVPDKILNELPFGSLVSSTSNKYLIEDFGITYSPSSSIFILCSVAAAAKPLISAERLLSVGDPSFDSRQFQTLSDLPSAANEARIIATYYHASRVLVGSSATKKLVEQEMKRSDVVHLALHSIPQEQAHMRSKLVLASEADVGSQESGTLQAYEIYGLRLPKTRLVVLSGCQTGIDRYYNGEGMLSIARPFIVSGVPLVVASLWPVDSEATAALMTAFHRNRKQRSLSTAEALRHAQLELAKSPDSPFRDPYFWAAFFGVGGETQF